MLLASRSEELLLLELWLLMTPQSLVMHLLIYLERSTLLLSIRMALVPAMSIFSYLPFYRS